MGVSLLRARHKQGRLPRGSWQSSLAVASIVELKAGAAVVGIVEMKTGVAVVVGAAKSVVAAAG